MKQTATYTQDIYTEEHQLKISEKKKLKKYVDVRERGIEKLPNEALLFSTVSNV